MIFLWIILIALAIWAIWHFSKGKSFFPSASRENEPLDILKRRYAQGEISKEEFEEQKTKLEESH